MGVSPNDAALAQCIGPATEDDDTRAAINCPQSLINLMPSADAYLARLTNLARDFMPPDPVLTCTTMRWWVDRVVAHLTTCDVHPAPTTIQ